MDRKHENISSKGHNIDTNISKYWLNYMVFRGKNDTFFKSSFLLFKMYVSISSTHMYPHWYGNFHA